MIEENHKIHIFSNIICVWMIDTVPVKSLSLKTPAYPLSLQDQQYFFAPPHVQANLNIQERQGQENQCRTSGVKFKL